MKYLKKKSFIITALIFFTACLISGGLVYLNIKKENQSALAAPICGDNNIAGFAWSDNIGWLSFNSGDCDKNNNGFVDKNEIPTVDASPNDVGYTSSIAIGSDGLPVISYYDATNEDLKFIKCGNLSCTRNNIMQVLDNGDDIGYSSSIAIGSDGYPVISYFDKWSSGGPSSKFLFIKCNSSDCSSRNSPITIKSGNTGWSFGRWLAIDSSDLPIMAYRDVGLYFTKCGNVNCSSENNNYNLNNPTSLRNDGFGVNLVVDSSNIPTITNTATGGDGKLRLVRCGDSSCSTGNNTVTASDYMADYPAASLDHAMTLSSDEKSMVVYYRAGTNQLRYYKCNDSNCSSRTAEIIIDSFSDNGGGTNWKEYVSIAKGSDGFAIISYYDFTTTKQDLKFVNCNNAECTDRTITTIDSDGDVGLFSSTVLGPDGFPIISYYDLTNGNLKVAKCLNADCTSVFKDGCGGNDDVTTPVIPYGVKIDWPTGNFSGYAWSSNIGWVSFNRKTCDGGVDNGKGCIQASDCDGSVPCELTGPGATGVPPEAPYGAEDYIANYNSGTGDVTGWAKALALGDDGWIKLSDASWNNGVTINGTSKEFEGWAWNGNITAGTGIGWLSFSHLNCDTDGDGIRETGEGSSGCPAVGTAIADYKVYITNSSPTAIDLKAPNITYPQACSSRDARRVQLTWEFDDPDEVAPCNDVQSFYQVIVDTQDHTSAELESMEVNTDSNLPLKTPKLPGQAWSLYPTNPYNTPDYVGVDLSYDEHYYWWVKVWDKYGADSGWVQYDSDLLTPPTDTDNDDTGQPGCASDCDKTFWTYKHEFPEPYFYWFPLAPSEGENVSFWDGSYYYTPSEPNTNRQLCFRDGIEYCDDFQDFQWTPSNLATQISSPTASSTSIIFEPAKTSQDITLQTTDPTGYYCSTSTTFWAKVKLPTWKEVKYR